MEFPPKKILICDDHPIIHTGIKYTLKEIYPETSFEIESAFNAKEALSKIETLKPDLLFLDLNLPDISGLEVLKRLKHEKNNLRTIILTGETSLPIFLQLSRYKISGILLKTYDNHSFEEALNHLLSNEESLYIAKELAEDLKNEISKQRLSEKEFEVLTLLVKGYSNKAIAHVLKCSPETIKTHLSHIGGKTSMTNRDDLITWFYKGSER